MVVRELDLQPDCVLAACGTFHAVSVWKICNEIISDGRELIEFSARKSHVPKVTVYTAITVCGSGA